MEEARTLQFVLPEPLVCEASACGYSSSNLQEMRNHMKKEHPSIKHQCSQCIATFPLIFSLERHMVSYHKPDRHRSLCNICGQTFAKDHRLKRHLFTKHNIWKPGIKVHECNYPGCHFKTLASSDLRSHKRRHVKDKPFTCEVCGLKLKTEKSHKKHLDKMHLGIRPYLCQICGMRFGEDHELKAHTLCRHSGEKNYQCEYCTYSTSNKLTFYTHLFNIHKVQASDDKREMFKCPHCPYTSLLGYHYKLHINSHQGKRDYPCNYCDQKFLSANARLSHTQWKHLEKVYSCTQCVYQTKTSKKLNEHIRVQHQLKGLFPYKCAYCSFKCATSGNTRKHIKQVHKDMEVKYFRDDDLIDAARVARQSGNHSGITDFVSDDEDHEDTIKPEVGALAGIEEQMLKSYGQPYD